MESSAGRLYTSIAAAVGYDPENVSYKAAVFQEMNEQADFLCGYRAWPFAMATTTVTARGDYTTGKAQFTNGSNVVTGSLLASWTNVMASAWVAPGSDPEPQDFVRIGRVDDAKTDSLLLVDPYPGATTYGDYTIRWRFIQLPRDCLRLDGLGPGENNFNRFEFVPSDEALRRGWTERLTAGGIPFALIPGAAPQWLLGMGQPRTPDNAPSATLAPSGVLIVGHVYEWRYTWFHHGVETGSSPIVSATPTAANRTAWLSGLQECTALDGRYIRFYRRDKTLQEPWYSIGRFYDVTIVVDNGLALDRTLHYYDSNSVYLLRTWPRATAGTTYNFDIRYQSRPRNVQKDTDYFDMPEDAVTVIKYLTIAALATRFKALAIAARAEKTATRLIEEMEAAHLTERVRPFMREGIYVPSGRRSIPWGFPTIRQT